MRHLSLPLLLAFLACDEGTTVVATEQACDDALDDDDDGLTDCDDPDCDEAVECSWPEGLAVDGRFDFEPTLLGELGGATPCTIRYTSNQERERPSECADCARSFHGPFTYVTDNCPPDTDRPTEGSYGLEFTSETHWRAWFRDLDDAWTLMGVAEHDG